jgi:S1 RNA binding domain protein
MDIEVGTIHAGKVTGITRFGAFVTIAPGKSGLVHISEIAGSYVNEVRDHLSEEQDVTVKVLGIDQSGRLNLSIKAALNNNADEFRRQSSKQKPQAQNPSNQQFSSEQPQDTEQDSYFEDQLKRFMQDSNSRMSGLKNYSEKKISRRRSR